MAVRTGTRASDDIRGTKGDDTISGLAGDDILFGLKGADALYGGKGNDVLDGGEGDDRLFGGAGDDRIVIDPTRGFSAADVVSGGAGTDTLQILGGVAGESSLDFGTLAISRDFEVVDARGYALTLDRARLNTVSALVASRVIVTDGGDLGQFTDTRRADEIVFSDAGNSVDLSLLTGPEVRVIAGAGNDTIIGRDLDDDLYGLAGGAGDDNVYGRGGNDDVRGGDGNDLVRGGDGDDYVVGGDGDDRLDGGAGNDTMIANNGVSETDGVDILIGGDGDDTMYLLANYTGDRLIGGDGFDTVFVAGDLSQASVGQDIEKIDGMGAIVTSRRLLQFEEIAHSIIVSDAADLDFSGKTLRNANIRMGASNDHLTIGTGYSIGNTVIDGGAGDDVVTGGEYAVKLLGGDGDDTLTGNGISSTSNDLRGGNGDDVLIVSGGGGDLYGGAGSDLFVVEEVSRYRDIRVRDFAVGTDHLDVSAFYASFEAVQRNLSADGFGQTLLKLPQGVTLVLYQVDLATLQPSDFIFGP